MLLHPTLLPLSAIAALGLAVTPDFTQAELEELSARIGKQVDPWLATGIMFLAATGMVSVYGGSELNGDNWARFVAHPTVWFGLYSILFATVLTYVLNTWALRHAHSSQVALYINVQPIVAAALAPLVGMAGPDWRFFVALAAVTTALILQTRPGKAASSTR